MKIAFLCPSVTRSGGGLFEIQRNLARSLALLPGTAVEVFGTTDAHTAADLPAWAPVPVRHFSYAGPSSFRYSPALRSAFLGADADVAHLHALWTHSSLVLRAWSRKTNRPCVVTPNGMLEPWALRHSGWKKRLAEILYERRSLHGAACVQVNTEEEARYARAFGLRQPLCLIPNGVVLPEEKETTRGEAWARAPWAKLVPPDSKVLLYLGRLHPKKGLAALLEAWARARLTNPDSTWVLVIAGWDELNHRRELEKLADDLGLRSSVFFVGPQFDEAKSAAYRACDAFILPSLSEGLPIAVLEAWAWKKPVLMTPGCHLPEGFSAGAALRVEPEAAAIAKGLHQLFEMSGAERQTMGERGRALVAERFTWPGIAAQMRLVYAWLCDGGPRPDFVITT